MQLFSQAHHSRHGSYLCGMHHGTQERVEFSHFQLAVARLFSYSIQKIVNKLLTPSILRS